MLGIHLPYLVDRRREPKELERFLGRGPLLSMDSDVEHDGLFLSAFSRVYANDSGKAESIDGEPSAYQCLIAPATGRRDRTTR